MSNLEIIASLCSTLIMEGKQYLRKKDGAMIFPI